MASDPTHEELARLAEEDWANLKKILPFKEFLRIWGPMNRTSWIRRLDKDPAARERIKELGGEEALRSGLEIPASA